ncbi:uncharacterized protein LOC116772284 [Danaus plexippus]|uniref:uncharacterized protein LOC116772284 n=1 Tax=Danaus plexippus TaxID=13037 RepID=UPI002AAFD923|nr:uncharacterized protein LOC116772284 [Danaus plexippus]
MAKLHNYYVLCPLIDQNSFLGVSQDKDDENVIVTLGRNVVNKYRLSDQKQIGGWTSKEHLTSYVIYDKEQEGYVGVFNKNTIKIWKEDSDNLDKTKKHKFSVNILKLQQKGDNTIIIFENGYCASLSYALENRKTYEGKPLIKDAETVVDSACFTLDKTDYICYVIKNTSNNYEILTSPLREELGDMDKSKICKVKVTRPHDVYVVGKLINIDESPSVYILWSDSKMSVYNLVSKSWTNIGTVPWISTLTSVSLAWMGKDHLILFGSNTDQDGAIIVAYNVILGVGSCRYPMKMYAENAHLYCFNGRIILEASNHIGMLPYILETNRNLSSLLGSHDTTEDSCIEVAEWGIKSNPLFAEREEIKDLLKVGVTERNMCSQVLLPLLEEKDFRHVYNVVREFKDVPESVLVSILNYTIEILNAKEIDVNDHEEFMKFCDCEMSSTEQANEQRAKFQLLDYLFEITFSDALLIPYLRNGLTLDNALFLLSYISYLLTDSHKEYSDVYESKLFDWCTLLIDAFYQQYLLTKDDKVVQVLNNVQRVVVNLIDQLMTVDNVLPMLHKILSGKPQVDHEESLSYTIELMDI